MSINAGFGPLDREIAAAAEDKLQLRVWLRLLTCAQMIERRVRTQLRLEFDTTLPRFDLLAQLDSSDGMLSMGELSSRLMVSSGNVTGLIDSMEKDRLVTRKPHPVDRRSILIHMTPAGRSAFAEMVPLHQEWVDTMMGSMTRAEMRALLELLGKLKNSVRTGEAMLSALTE